MVWAFKIKNFVDRLMFVHSSLSLIQEVSFLKSPIVQFYLQIRLGLGQKAKPALKAKSDFFLERSDFQLLGGRV